MCSSDLTVDIDEDISVSRIILVIVGAVGHVIASLLVDLVQSLRQCLYCAINVVQLFKAEKTQAERLEVIALITLQGNTCSNLQPDLGECFSSLDIDVAGVTDNDAWSLEPLSGYALNTSIVQQFAYLRAEFNLLLAELFEA